MRTKAAGMCSNAAESALVAVVAKIMKLVFVAKNRNLTDFPKIWGSLQLLKEALDQEDPKLKEAVVMFCKDASHLARLRRG